MEEPVTSDPGAQLLSAIEQLNEALARVPGEDLGRLLDESLKREDLDGSLSSALTALRSRILNLGLTHRLLNDPATDDPPLSPLHFPAGLTSPDRSAVLGRDGHLFLIGGSNDVLAQYAPTCTDADTLPDRWMQIFLARHRWASANGKEYFQVIVPEKISAIPQLYPHPIATPTRLLAELERRIAASELAGRHVSGMRLIGADHDPSSTFKKLDSHLSPRGAYLTFSALLEAMTGQAPPPVTFATPRREMGDMAIRMMGNFPFAEHLTLSVMELPEFTRTPVKVEDETPDPTRLRGRRQVWRNPLAPVDKTVAAFANSFFSFEETGPSGLSWWFARWFREFHFMWNNEVEFDYAAAAGADIVVWQGNERFLPVVSGS